MVLLVSITVYGQIPTIFHGYLFFVFSRIYKDAPRCFNRSQCTDRSAKSCILARSRAFSLHNEASVRTRLATCASTQSSSSGEWKHRETQHNEVRDLHRLHPRQTPGNRWLEWESGQVSRIEGTSLCLIGRMKANANTLIFFLRRMDICSIILRALP